MKRIFCILFVTVLMLSLSLMTAVPASAATPIYVDASTGNDAYDGEATEWDGTHGPKQTINAGIGVVDPGGTVYVAAGTYNEHVLVSKPINILSYVGANPIVDGGASGACFGIYSSGGLDGVAIDGFEIQNATYGVWIYGSPSNYSNIAISNNDIHGHSQNGILVTDASVDGLSIIGNTVASSGIGISFASAPATFMNLTIDGNDITGNNAGLSLISGTFNNVTVTDCYFSGNAWEHVDLGCWNNNPSISNVQISGCEFMGGPWAAIYAQATTANIAINGNEFCTSACGIWAASTSETIDAENNFWGDSSGPGTGDSVYGDVDFDPWATLVYTGGPQPYDNVVLEATVSNWTEPAEIEFYFDGSFVDSAPIVGGVATLSIGPRSVGVHDAYAVFGCVQSESALVAVYDPTAGFVTGGGWINSPPGAYANTPPCQIHLSGDTAEMNWRDYTYMDRTEAAICSPNADPVTFTGTVDVSGLWDNGAVLIGLVDKKWIDDGGTGFMGGAYTYFGRRVDNLIVGPSDGNLGGEIVQIFVTLVDYFDPVVYPGGPPLVSFEMTVHSGVITVSVAGGTYTDDYGVVKTLNNKDAYSWAEFEFGAYAGVDSWPPENSVLYDVTIEGCGCPATGKANFGFVAKYNKKTNDPEGNTEFVFKAGDLNFHSSIYDWLVINKNYSRAQYKGTGTVNGAGEYKFMLWALDGDPDTFRIKIWTEEGGVETVVYDNGPEQPIGGGNIVVHTK